MKCLKDKSHGQVVESIHTENAYRCPVCNSLFDISEFKDNVYLKVSHVVEPDVRYFLRGKGFVYYVRTGVWIKKIKENRAKEMAKNIMSKAIRYGSTRIIIERMSKFIESDYS